MRRRAEPRFNHEFDRVRVHTGREARSAAEAIDAHAFTVGNHVVLGQEDRSRSGAIDPILAHELAHAAQQADVPAHSATGVSLGRPDDPAEHEADLAARRVMAGERAGAPRHLGAPIIQRQTKPIAQDPEAPAEKPVEGGFEDCDQVVEVDRTVPEVKQGVKPIPGRKLSKKAIILEHLEEGRKWTKAAHDVVRNLLSKPSSVDEGRQHAFFSNFRFNPSPRDPKTLSRLREIEEAYARMEAGFNQRVTFKCDDEPGFAEVRSCSEGILVHRDFFKHPTCPGVPESIPTQWGADKDKRNRTRMIVHEMAHLYGGRKWGVGLGLRQCGGEVYQDLPCPDKEVTNQPKSFKDLFPDEAIGNADCYAVFAEQMFAHAKADAEAAEAEKASSPKR